MGVIMMNRMLRYGGLLAILVFAGCDALRSGTEKGLREFIAASNDLSDTLDSVRDPQTAEASLAVLDEKYSRYCAAVQRLPELDFQAKASKTTVEEIGRNIASANERLKNEYPRLKGLRGLPPRFWEIVTVRNLEMVVALEATPLLAGNQLPKATVDFMRETCAISIARCGYGQIVQVEFANLTPVQTQAAFDKLLKLAPGATLYHAGDGVVREAILGPVKDFRAFVAGVDFGTVVYDDEPRRALTINVDGRKLGGQVHPIARVNADVEESNPAAEARRAQAREFQRVAEQQRKKFSEEQAAREKERRGPDPSDPDYYEKLADRLASSNFMYRREAMDVLLNTDPSQVTSAEARKKIARTFKQLAEDDSSFDRKKAIHGLVIWGGKYSVPILLKMLDRGHPFGEDEIIRALGELKDPQAAPALAARLSHFSLHQAAFDALTDIGSGAEDAVREVGMTDDPKICMTAITLLGNIGTIKSIPFLDRAQGSRNRAVRLAARSAAQKINVRTLQAKKNKS